jgi:hypothetical protein
LVIGKMINNLDLGLHFINVMNTILDNIKMENLMDKVFLHLKMVPLMKDNGLMVNKRDLG